MDASIATSESHERILHDALSENPLNVLKIFDLLNTHKFNPNYRDPNDKSNNPIYSKIFNAQNVSLISIFIEKYIDSIDILANLPLPHSYILTDSTYLKLLKKSLQNPPMSSTGYYLYGKNEKHRVYEIMFEEKKYQCFSYLMIEKDQYPTPEFQIKFFENFTSSQIKTSFLTEFNYLISHPKFDWKSLFRRVFCIIQAWSNSELNYFLEHKAPLSEIDLTDFPFRSITNFPILLHLYFEKFAKVETLIADLEILLNYHNFLNFFEPEKLFSFPIFRQNCVLICNRLYSKLIDKQRFEPFEHLLNLEKEHLASLSDEVFTSILTSTQFPKPLLTRFIEKQFFSDAKSLLQLNKLPLFDEVWAAIPVSQRPRIISQLLNSSEFVLNSLPSSIISEFLEKGDAMHPLKLQISLFPIHSDPAKVKQFFPTSRISIEKFLSTCEQIMCRICLDSVAPGNIRHFACKTIMHRACLDKHLLQTPGELLIRSKIKCPFCRINIENAVPESQPGKVFVSAREIEWLEANEPVKEHAVCEKCHCVFEVGERSCSVSTLPPSSVSTLPPSEVILPPSSATAAGVEIKPPRKCEACAPASKIFNCPKCGMQLQHRGGCSAFVCCYYGADGCRGSEIDSATKLPRCDHGARILTTGNVIFCGHRFSIAEELRQEYGEDGDATEEEEADSD